MKNRYPRIVTIGGLFLSLLLFHGCGVNEDICRAEGFHAYRIGDWAEARTHFEHCVTADATDWKSHYYLGVIALKESDPYRARRHLESAETLRSALPDSRLSAQPGSAKTFVPYPTRTQISDALAQSMFEQGMRQRLYQYLQQQVSLYGTTDDYYRLAHWMSALGDRDAAELAYRKAARIAANEDATPHLKLADFYDAIGDRESALIELRKAYTINPSIPGLADNIRAHGMVPGPTIRILPERWRTVQPPQENTETEESAEPNDVVAEEGEPVA